MKRLLLAACGTVIMCACGGGSGSSGGGSTPPATPPSISVSISPSNQSYMDQGQAMKFTAAVANDSSSKGVTWSASANGVTGAGAGAFSNTTASATTYDAPASVAGTLTVSVTATSVADPTKSTSSLVTVSPPPAISTIVLTNATPDANYRATLQATGGAGNLTWTIAGGALPAGLSLSNSGVIAGDPTVPGSFAFSVQVTDSSNAAGGPASAQAELSLTVLTAVSISTGALPAGSVGASYLSGMEASGGTPPYVWSIVTGPLPPGLSMQPASGVISGIPTAPGNFSFTVAARDSSPTQQIGTQPFAIAMGPPGPLTIATTLLLDGTVNSPYQAKLVAVGGMPPYTWKVTSGALPAGISFNGSAISGAPSAAGTSSFVVTVADSSSENQQQALSITVDSPAEACTSSGNNGALNGPYAFTLSGYSSEGFLIMVGSFTADGTGKIIAGEADTNGILGPQNSSILTAASSYSVGPDNRGCATLAMPFGTFVVRFVLDATPSNIATLGRVIAWGSPSASAYVASGVLLRQNSSAFSAALNGGYAFRTLGWDPSIGGGRDACVGAISAMNGVFTGLEQDCNDATSISSTAAPALAGTYTSADANGRATGIVSLGQSNSNIVFYIVASSQLLAVNADPGPFLSGEWDQQDVPEGGAGFTQASLKGNLVMYLGGLSLSGTATASSFETANADGNSSLAIAFYEDRAGTMQVPGTFACTYAVEPNGRITLSSPTQSCGDSPPLLYLTGLNSGFIIDAAPGVDAGSFEPQSAGPFANASLSGNFAGGMPEVAIQGAQTEVDAVSLDESGKFSGVTDLSSSSAQDTGAPFPAPAYSVNADGTFAAGSSNGAVAGVVISGTKFVMFSPSTVATPYPSILIMQR
jgi:hypothetical protein